MDSKIDGVSMDIEAMEREKLKAVFPQCFTEGKLDIDKLLSLCGEYIVDDFEKYEFKWKGKSECLQLAQKRSTGTLRPCKEESVNFDSTQNLYIEGDNLEVLKLLQTSYYRKVKMIYIDPPYNTGHDFVYADDFADPMARYKEITSQTTKSNPETMGRYHTNWLNMMYPRLRLAANLLRDDGVCFISIDDNEVHNLRKVCDEVFGEENFITTITWEKRYSPQNAVQWFSEAHDFILVYTKFKESWFPNLLERSEEMNARYRNLDNDPRGDWKPENATAQGGHGTDSQFYELISPTGNVFKPPTGRCWVYTEKRMREMIADNRIWFGSDGNSSPAIKRFLTEVKQGVACQTIWKYDDVGHSQEGKKEIKMLFPEAVPFDTPKPTRLIKRILQLSTTPHSNDIILDFFSGSATTGHAVMQLNAEDGGNRRFIMVQLPEVCDEKSEAHKAGYENICEIGKERIRRAGTKIANEIWPQAEMGKYAIEHGKKADGGSLLSMTYAFTPTGSDKTEYKNTVGNKTFEALIEERGLVPPDVGFRVFKLDTSNLKTWDNTPIVDGDLLELERRLRGMLDIIKDDRSNEDVVYEVMLKLGQDLCENILTLDINGKTAYGVGATNNFIVCLASSITAEDAEEMAKYAPGSIIFTDGCFDTSSEKRNVQLTLKDRNINMKML